MELLVFVLIAGVAGYLLARSRFSKSIDDSAHKVADASQKAAKTTEGWASRVGSWISKTLKLEKKPKEEVVDVAAVKTEPVSPAEPAQPASRQPSRRKSDEDKSE